MFYILFVPVPLCINNLPVSVRKSYRCRAGGARCRVPPSAVGGRNDGDRPQLAGGGRRAAVTCSTSLFVFAPLRTFRGLKWKHFRLFVQEALGCYSGRKRAILEQVSQWTRVSRLCPVCPASPVTCCGRSTRCPRASVSRTALSPPCESVPTLSCT